MSVEKTSSETLRGFKKETQHGPILDSFQIALQGPSVTNCRSSKYLKPMMFKFGKSLQTGSNKTAVLALGI